MNNLKKSLVTVLFLGMLLPSLLFAQSDIEKSVVQKIDESANPRESLVQWYYGIDSFYSQIAKTSSGHAALPRIATLRQTLRAKLTAAKKAANKSQLLDFGDLYRTHITTKDVSLSSLCKEKYELVDDRSYALNLPTALVLSTWDMESSCGRSKPANSDGVFQITAKDYGTGTLTTGQWIMMMYDFSILLSGKYERYHNANNLSQNTCTTKNKFLTGQIAPICLTYASLDLDSIIKHGALYNGLSGATIKGDIQPAAGQYVYGRYTDAYSGSVKDGLITRMLKVVQYMRETNQ